MSNLREAAQRVFDEWHESRDGRVSHYLMDKLEKAILGQPDEHPSFENMLGNLLARIHRDGGHYINEHGWGKAFLDADAKVVQWIVDSTSGEQPFQRDWMNYKQGVADGKAEAEQGAELALPKPDCPNIWGSAYSEKQVRAIIAADRAARKN